MKRVILRIVGMTVLYLTLVTACHKAPESHVPETPGDIQLDFVPSFGADTRAVKTTWENGDAVFIFFNGITGTPQAPKYLKLSYAGSNKWSVTQMGGLLVSDLWNAADKKFTALYLPFTDDAAVFYTEGTGFGFDPSPQSLYWASGSLPYNISISSTQATLSLVSGSHQLPLNLPEGFVQIFLDDDSAIASTPMRLYEDHLTPVDVVVTTQGVVVQQLGAAGSALPGHIYDKENKGSGDSKGWLFSGILDPAARALPLEYTFRLQDGTSMERHLTATTTFYTSESARRAAKLPPLEYWSTLRYIPAKFSVSPSKQVYFSSGNLVVINTFDGTDSQREWAFEDAQWSSTIVTDPVLPRGVGYLTPNTPVRITHFSWATAGVKNPLSPGTHGLDYGYDPNHVYFYPHDYHMYYPTDSQFSSGCGYGPSWNSSNTHWADNLPATEVSNGAFVDLSENNSWNANPAVRAYCDWGIHFDDTGVGLDSTTDGEWYTLSVSEWTYLLEGRPNASSLVGKAEIKVPGHYSYPFGFLFGDEPVKGLVILPDNWQTPSGCSFIPGGTEPYATNKYTSLSTQDNAYPSGLWPEMEAAGAVFLPCAGYRADAGNAASLSNAQLKFYGNSSSGYYYSSSARKAPPYPSAFFVSFLSNRLDLGRGSSVFTPDTGCSVRLVHENPIPGSPVSGINPGLVVIGDEQDF